MVVRSFSVWVNALGKFFFRGGANFLRGGGFMNAFFSP